MLHHLHVHVLQVYVKCFVFATKLIINKLILIAEAKKKKRKAGSHPQNHHYANMVQMCNKGGIIMVMWQQN